MLEVLNRASSQDFKTSGFPLNPERFRDGNDGDVVTIMRPLIGLCFPSVQHIPDFFHE